MVASHQLPGWILSLVALLLSLAAAGELPPTPSIALANTTPWGVLTIGITPEGALPKEAVSAGLKQVNEALGACFPDATTVPTLSVRFVVNAGGRPGAIDATPTPAAPAVETCVEQALGAVVFAGAAGETRVALTLTASDKLELQGLIGMKGTQLGSGAAAPQGSPPRAPPVTLAPGVTVDGFHAIILGALEKARIDEVVFASGPAFGACADAARKRNPALAGTILLKFQIEATGKLASVVVKSTSVGDPDLEACAVRAAQAWVFPPVRGGGIVIASYPFKFGPPAAPPVTSP